MTAVHLALRQFKLEKMDRRSCLRWWGRLQEKAAHNTTFDIMYRIIKTILKVNGSRKRGVFKTSWGKNYTRKNIIIV